MRKTKKEKIDGLSPDLIKKIRNAIRLIWHRSHPRKLCVERATGKDGFFYCESCERRSPKIKIDHKQNVGAIDSGFIERMFTPSVNLQALCAPCHNEKTKAERAKNKKPKKKKDFARFD